MFRNSVMASSWCREYVSKTRSAITRPSAWCRINTWIPRDFWSWFVSWICKKYVNSIVRLKITPSLPPSSSMSLSSGLVSQFSCQQSVRLQIFQIRSHFEPHNFDKISETIMQKPWSNFCSFLSYSTSTVFCPKLLQGVYNYANLKEYVGKKSPWAEAGWDRRKIGSSASTSYGRANWICPRKRNYYREKWDSSWMLRFLYLHTILLHLIITVIILLAYPSFSVIHNVTFWMGVSALRREFLYKLAESVERQRVTRWEPRRRCQFLEQIDSQREVYFRNGGGTPPEKDRGSKILVCHAPLGPRLV